MEVGRGGRLLHFVDEKGEGGDSGLDICMYVYPRTLIYMD